MNGRIIFAQLGLVLAAATMIVVAQESGGPPGFNLDWNTIDGGGGAAAGGGFELAGTIGQPDASGLAGGGFELAGGFWPGVQPAPEPTCAPDISPPGGDGLVNVNDLLLVIGNWGATVPPANVADINGDLIVNVNDLLAVIGMWGACP